MNYAFPRPDDKDQDTITIMGRKDSVSYIVISTIILFSLTFPVGPTRSSYRFIIQYNLDKIDQDHHNIIRIPKSCLYLVLTSPPPLVLTAPSLAV